MYIFILVIDSLQLYIIWNTYNVFVYTDVAIAMHAKGSFNEDLSKYTATTPTTATTTTATANTTTDGVKEAVGKGSKVEGKNTVETYDPGTATGIGTDRPHLNQALQKQLYILLW